MSKINSIRAYPHCKQIWDEAYASESGSIIIEHSDTGKPMTLSQQISLITDLLHYRVLLRKENTKFYPEGHPEYMTSIFDPLIVTKATINGKLCVRIRKRRVEQYKIIQEDLE